MLEDQIEKIIAEFDFGRVRKCMKLMDWTWVPNDEVPSIKRLMKEARQLLKDVSKMPAGSRISSGGFWATKIFEDELTLQFSISSADGVDGE